MSDISFEEMRQKASECCDCAQALLNIYHQIEATHPQYFATSNQTSAEETITTVVEISTKAKALITSATSTDNSLIITTSASKMHGLYRLMNEIDLNLHNIFDPFFKKETDEFFNNLQQINQIISQLNDFFSQKAHNIRKKELRIKTSDYKPPLTFDLQTMSTGISSIDQQHKILFDLVERLEEEGGRDCKFETIEDALNLLGSYIVQHFEYEEHKMDELKCPTAKENHEAHRRLIYRYNEWKEDYQKLGGSHTLLGEMTIFLREWLVGHICKVDRCMMTCVSHTEKT